MADKKLPTTMVDKSTGSLIELHSELDAVIKKARNEQAPLVGYAAIVQQGKQAKCLAKTELMQRAASADVGALRYANERKWNIAVSA